MDDLSILIQGPLNEISLSNLGYYRTLGTVVISCWDSDDLSLLLPYAQDRAIRVTKNPLPTHKVYHQPTFDFQVHSVMHGMDAVDTEYVIRTRSDERWGNLQPLIKKYERRESDVVCGNIFFKRWDDLHFHPGDHLFIGKTNLLRAAYKRLRFDSSKYVNCYCAEMSFAHAVMDVLERGNTKEAFVEAFGVVDINELAPFIAQFRQGNITYTDEFNEACAIKTMEGY